MAENSIEAVPPFNPRAGKTTLCVLGGFALRDGSGRSIDLNAKKSRLLLAYLAVPPDQTRTRDQLATLLWNNSQDEQARGSLRTALAGIRRALGPDALIVQQDTIRLRPDHLACDYDYLKSLSGGDTPVASLGNFYAGEFLEGIEFDNEHFLDWQRSLRAECADFAIKVLEKNAARLEQDGRYQEAIELLRESLSLEPLKEKTHRNIMRLHAANGERAMALAQFRTCKEVLIHELEAAPDPETQALADSIALRDVSVSNELRRQAEITIEAAASRKHVPALPDVMNGVAEKSALSIAVLPFVNMSGDAEQSYFADGITEDISIDLSKFDRLSIAAKSSGELFRGSPTPPAQIARELDVKYLLQGSVRKSGDNVRVSAHLIEAQSNRQIWADRYDRALDNIFALQSEIAQAIVTALKINLKLEDSNRLGSQITTSGEAYQIYLHGKSAREFRTKADNTLALGLFQRAVAVDPKFAKAYAGIAECQSVLAEQNMLKGSEFVNALEEAKSSCQKALEIDPNLAEAYLALGHIRASENMETDAKKGYLKAIELDPKLAAAHYSLGNHYLGIEHDAERALPSFKTAFALDPNSRCSMMLLTALSSLNHPELKIYANEIMSISRRRAAANPHDFNAIGLVAYAYYFTGYLEEAKHWTNIVSAFEIDDTYFCYNLGCMFSNLGEIDSSLEALERSFKLKHPNREMAWVRSQDPDLDKVREDPRFYELLERFGI